MPTYSSNFFDNENGGQIDGVLVENQPGSSMKPFLYALALEKELIQPSSVLADVPTEFGNEKLYIPENFNKRFNGPVRTRIALASSLNVPAVYLLYHIGVDSYFQLLQKLGFTSLKNDRENLGLSLALGAGEVHGVLLSDFGLELSVVLGVVPELIVEGVLVLGVVIDGIEHGGVREVGLEVADVVGQHDAEDHGGDSSRRSV